MTYQRNYEERQGLKKRASDETWEDYFINLDSLEEENSLPNMRMLVRGFEEALDADFGAAIEDYGLKIWQRALYLIDQKTTFLDDRILYWTRLRLSVILKNYLSKYSIPFVIPIRRFEQISRGYLADFSKTPTGAKRILLSGYDPFRLDEEKKGNIQQSNPSGMAALKLHGKEQILEDGQILYFQACLIPVRYRDFDQDDGLGIIEEIFSPFVDEKHPEYQGVDMIMTMSQGGAGQFWIDRFASRFRGILCDNETEKENPEQCFPKEPIGDEFYETMLPYEKMVPWENKEYPEFRTYLNNNFKYSIQQNGAEEIVEFKESDEKGTVPFTEGPLRIESKEHPRNSLLKAPIPIPVFEKMEALNGSGGLYLSNEIHYRLSRLRTIHQPKLWTGHLHVPLIQTFKPEKLIGKGFLVQRIMDSKYNFVLLCTINVLLAKAFVKNETL